MCFLNKYKYTYVYDNTKITNDDDNNNSAVIMVCSGLLKNLQADRIRPHPCSGLGFQSGK